MTKIEWTDRTWNPITGCTKVSPGCDNCYMFRQYPRLRGMNVPGYQRSPKQVLYGIPRKDNPARWRLPQKVFVCSMSDLFHPQVPFEYIHKIFAFMASLPRHTFQVLTKRPGRMAYFANTYHPPYWGDRGTTWGARWPSNVWAGTSVESSKYLPRLDVLARVPAKVRFVSAEPLLGPLDLRPYLGRRCTCGGPAIYRANGGEHHMSCDASTHALWWRRKVDWVILGGESGPGARPMHPQWAGDIRDQCQEAGVPFFFKQWGEWAPMQAIGATSWTITKGRHGILRDINGNDLMGGKPIPYDNPYASEISYHIGKKAAGALLDGREWREFPVELR